MPDLHIPGTLLAAALALLMTWMAKEFLSALKMRMAQPAMTQRMLDEHIRDCLLHRQAMSQLSEQVANMDDRITDLGVDNQRFDVKLDKIMDHLIK